jgi:hypothetical protein
LVEDQQYNLREFMKQMAWAVYAGKGKNTIEISFE